MFDKLFKKCKHEYKQVGIINSTVGLDGVIYSVPCYFYECKHCGKRRILKESDIHYSYAFLETMKMWEKRQYKINFKGYKEQHNGESFTTSKKDSKYREALERVSKEVEQLEIPMHDNKSRLIVNNIKGIVNNALTEEVTNGEETE